MVVGSKWLAVLLTTYHQPHTKMITPDFLAELERFNLIVHKRVTSNYVGTRRSASVGHGLTFADHYPYVPGEDFRKIDWKVYARSDDLFVRRMEEERNLTIRIIIDKSGSMKFGRKWDYTSMLGVGIAYLTMKENEKFQFLSFAEDVETFKPKRGRAHLARMIENLNNMDVRGKGNFLPAIQAIKKTLSSRSMIFIISDFLYDIAHIEESLALLGKHDLKLIQILDQKEKKMNLHGFYKLRDAETRAVLKTNFSPRLRSRYQKMLDAHIGQLGHLCRDFKADFHTVNTGQSIFDVFFEILRG